MRKRLLTLLLAVAAVLGLGLALTPAASAAPARPAATITGFYCAAPVAAPGASGSFTHCASWALSVNNIGQQVSHPYQCKLINNTSQNLFWYRESHYGYGGALEGNSYPSPSVVPAGSSETYTCSPDFTYQDRATTNYVRASVQAYQVTTATAGANVSSP